MLVRSNKPVEVSVQAPDDQTSGKHKQNRHDLLVALRVAAYTFSMFVVASYFLTNLWPTTTEDLALNTTRTVTLSGTRIQFPLGPETSLIFVIMLSGIIGACIFSLFAISHHLGADKDFDATWEAWYWLRPVIGAGLALVFYLLLRGGVLTIGADLKNLNLVGVAGVSGLVGMFAEQALHKLQDLSDTIFGSAPGGETKPDQPKNESTLSAVKTTP